MSVTDVVTRLRRAHDLITEALHATIDAETAITDGAAVFAAATRGSTQPEAAWIATCAAESNNDIHAARVLFRQAQRLIDDYCLAVAGHGIAAASTSLDTLAAPVSTGEPGPAISYAHWITEARRAGAKISPEKIIFMIRHLDGRLIWLEEGREDSAGQQHILRAGRRKDFDDIGLARTEIIPLVREAIARGVFVGYYGLSGEVYEIEVRRTNRRINVVIGDNGYIVTAYPIGSDEKVRVQRHRK